MPAVALQSPITGRTQLVISHDLPQTHIQLRSQWRYTAYRARGGFIDRDDAPIVYVEDYVGFDVNDQLAGQAIENGISNAIASQLGVENPLFAHALDADHPDYDNKREELVAKYDGSHPDVQP